MLFCDDLEIYKTPDINDKHPWNILFSPTSTPAELQAIIDQPNLETRPKILAYRKLAQLGQKIPNKEVLGIIIELAFDGSMDTLAAFKDGTARYINISGKFTVWDTQTTESQKIIEKLFQEGEIVRSKIGPWEEPRLAPPPQNDLRITLLVSDGLYFGQGESTVMFEDPIGAKLMDEAFALMQFLSKTNGVSI